MSELALSGIRVIDIAQVVSGPMATKLLGDMGAEVIKIESGFAYDTNRGMLKPEPGEALYPDNVPGDRPYNRAVSFSLVNRNKYGASLDLTKPEGLEVFKRLVKKSDVLLENWAAGVAERLGVGYEEMEKVKPDIIMVSMSGFGRGGPESNYRAFGVTQLQMSGLGYLYGYEDAPPLRSPMSPGDPIAAFYGASAALMALRYRRRTGKGQHIDLSQRETMTHFLGEAILDYVMNHRVAAAMGNHHAWIAPHGCYPCKGDDMWIVISISSDEEWLRLCQVARAEWADDERFSTPLKRWRNQMELDKMLSEWTAQHEHYELMHMLQGVGVAAEAVLTSKEIFSDPHLKERGYFENITHPEIGTYPYPGMEFRLSKAPGVVRMPAPCFAQHNDYVFGELLGMDSEEIAQLIEEQITGPVPLRSVEDQ